MADDRSALNRRRFISRAATVGGVTAGATVGGSVAFAGPAAAATDIDLTNSARVKNALNAVNDQDYVTLAQVRPANPILVAASGASAQVKAAALMSGGFVCVGADDQLQIQAAIDTADLAGRGVELSQGVFNVRTVAHPRFGNGVAAIRMRTGTRLWGRGSNRTTIRLVDGALGSSTNHAYIIINDAPVDGNSDLFIGDLTVDGNAANQTRSFSGISFWRSDRVHCERVVVKNARGTAGSGAEETFHFDMKSGANATYIECRAEGGSGSTATGFSINHSTNVRYYGCVTERMSVAHGFTMYQTRHVSYSNCFARNNAGIGFNWEYSDDVVYSGCHAGGTASLAADGKPYAANFSLGNGKYGFCGLGGQPTGAGAHQGRRATLIGCSSSRNERGLFLNGTRDVRVIGGSYTDNSAHGMTMYQDQGLAAEVVRSTQVIGALVSGNVTAQYDLPGGWVDTGVVFAPPLPASGATFGRVYPFETTVYLINGTVAGVALIDRAGVATSIGAPRTVVVPPGFSLAVTYSGALSWKWLGN
jgi:hypothetical protein